MFNRIRRVGMFACVIGLGAVASACAPDQAKEQTMRDRQDTALRDPFHYSPDMQRTDVSGGGMGNFDAKGFGKDLSDVINP